MLSPIPGIAEEYIVKLVDMFRALPRGTEVLLFGSRAKGNFREGSDIDIALKGNKITLEVREQLQNEYQRLNLPWKLDLVVYDLIEEPALREHIDRIGKKLQIK